MRAAVLDLDAASFPVAVTLPRGCTSALALIRWQGYPVGRAWLEAPDGLLKVRVLPDEIAARIADRRVQNYLEWEEVAPLSIPSTISATVAICTRDRLDDLARCLASMDALPGDEHEVLVIDSASRDGDAVRELVARHRRSRYVRELRPGLNVARNRAMLEARGEVIAFCDDDAVVDPLWLRALVRNFADVRTMCVTGLTMPLELNSEAQEWFETAYTFSRGFRRLVLDDSVINPFAASRVGAGVNMAVRRSLLEITGPFDPALDAGTPTKSGGDHDMFTRILLTGHRIVYDPAALNWHRHRREWTELLDTARGYGTGVWAFLTRHALQGEIAAPLIALSWLRTQLRDVARIVVLRPTGLRLDLSLAELRGCLAGPRAFLYSRRASLRHGPEAGE